LPADLAILGQFDAVLSAVLDEAYERADQKYRNATKLLAVIVATVLAIAGGWLMAGPAWSGRQFCVALLVGLSAAPVAPVTKDLASSLQAAVTAIGAARRVAPQ
jgi:hypothetical protein